MTRGRPPKPTTVLELSGAFKKDPQRKRARKNEPVTDGPLPLPIGRGLTQEEEDAVQWIVERAPQGVISIHDEIDVIQTAKLVVKMMNGSAKSAEQQLLSAKLGKFAMNPSDRSRLQVSKNEKPKNRWSDVG